MKKRISLRHNKPTVIGTLNKYTRDKWLERVLQGLPSGLRILDAGAGELQYKHLCKHLDYVSQDFGKYNGKGNNRGLQTKEWDQTKIDIVSDIVQIPQKDSSFDAIMCIEVFEHIPEPLFALTEFSRLLKTDGFLIITAPFCSLTHFAPYHYYSGFNKYFYERILPDYGFHIIEIENNGNFFEYLAQELRRIDFCASKYCNKIIKKREARTFNTILKMLQSLSDRDKGSDELLCFGYHILARKNKLE
jgi:ubiquinone/menaquinone biosynthesis C-methylase UbiE